MKAEAILSAIPFQPRVALSMIVKNEAHVIIRCLTSVLPLITYWKIVDTGSTDGTQQIIQDFFKQHDIPGELIQSNWIDDFSYSRNQALEDLENHADWGFWIDADEELQIQNLEIIQTNLQSNQITGFFVETLLQTFKYRRLNLWKLDKGWKWDGPVHEYLDTDDQSKLVALIPGCQVHVYQEGNSWAGGDMEAIKAKYRHHASILENKIKTDNKSRWVYYLAQSYRDAQDLPQALVYFRQRYYHPLPGLNDEKYVSGIYLLSQMIEEDKPKQQILEFVKELHRFEPFRVEHFHTLIVYLIHKEDWASAFFYALYAIRYDLTDPSPQKGMNMDFKNYQYKILDAFIYIASKLGLKKSAQKSYRLLKQRKQFFSDSEWSELLKYFAILDEQR